MADAIGKDDDGDDDDDDDDGSKAQATKTKTTADTKSCKKLQARTQKQQR